jgi:signal peptidase I
MTDAPTDATAEATPVEPPAVAPEPADKPESWWATLRFFLILFVLALLLRTLIAAPFSIPSGSMIPRLLIGDYLFVSKWSYGYSRYSVPFGLFGFDGRILGALPERGDVVVFRHPVEGNDLVKRVIGLPGDTIELRRGEVILNGRPLPRQRIADFALPVSPNSPCKGHEGGVRETPGDDGTTLCLYPRFRETLPGGRSYEVLDQITNWDGDSFGPVQVPEGRVFVMGDNRDDSLDSRFDPAAPDPRNRGVGLVPVDNLIGKVMVTFWSTDGSAAWLKPWTWFSAARWGRIGG